MVFQSDTMSTTVTYFRPTKGSSSSTTTKRNGGTTTKTTTKTATNNRAKILKIMRSTPTITLARSLLYVALVKMVFATT